VAEFGHPLPEIPLALEGVVRRITNSCAARHRRIAGACAKNVFAGYWVFYTRIVLGGIRCLKELQENMELPP
jgi:hypothetical protein